MKTTMMCFQRTLDFTQGEMWDDEVSRYVSFCFLDFSLIGTYQNINNGFFKIILQDCRPLEVFFADAESGRLC